MLDLLTRAQVGFQQPTKLNAPTYVFLLQNEKKQNPSRNLAKHAGGKNLAKHGKLEGVDFFLWNLHCKLLLHDLDGVKVI